MVVISWYESGWDPKNVGDQSLSQYGSRGLWQIFTGAHDPAEVGVGSGSWDDALVAKLEDPARNAHAAHVVFKEQGFRAWSTYNDLHSSSAWAHLLKQVTALPGKAPAAPAAPKPVKPAAPPVIVHQGHSYVNTGPVNTHAPIPADPKEKLDLLGNKAASADSSVARAAREALVPSENWHNLCLKFVRTCLGVGAKYRRAIDNWNAVPVKKRHGYYTPPKGVPVFWSGGSSGAGHVALSAGGGKVYSSDIHGAGTVALVPISEIHSRWGLTYLGWTETCEDVQVYLP